MRARFSVVICCLGLSGTVAAQAAPSPDDRSPSASPDGKRIVFHSQRDGLATLYAMKASGDDQVRLTSLVYDDRNPRWSPDGTHIVYQSRRDGEWFVHSIGPAGGEPMQLTGRPSMDPSFSPDGSSIVCVMRDTDGIWQVEEMSAVGEGARAITRSPSDKSLPAYSPDGARIAYLSSESGEDEIHVVDLDGSNETRVTRINESGEGHFVTGLCWTPRGDRILFTANLGGRGLFYYTTDLYTVAVDGSDVEKVIADEKDPSTRGMTSDSRPSFSADGKTILFDSVRGGGSDIYSVTARGKRLRNLTRTSFRHDYPAWAEGGDRIVFSSSRDGNGEIYIMNRDGSKPKNLTRHPAEERAPSVSRDGKRIAFVSYRESVHGHIFTMDTRGKKLERVTRDGFFEGLDEFCLSTAFTPDGMKVVFESAPVVVHGESHWDVWIVDVDGSHPTRLTNTVGGTRSSYASVSPNGKHIVYTTNGGAEGNFEIYRMDLDGGNKINLSNDAAVDYGASWSSDGEEIYFVSNRLGRFDVFGMAPDGSDAWPVTEVGRLSSEAWPVMSPDGTTLVIKAWWSGNLELYEFGFDGQSRLLTGVAR